MQNIKLKKDEYDKIIKVQKLIMHTIYKIKI